MAGIKRNWTKSRMMAVLLMSAGMFVCAQSARIGSLSGKLTNINSDPQAGVTVVVRNQATGVEWRTVTANDGAYSFDRLEAGEYTIEADSTAMGHGRLGGIRVSAGHLARVQAAMHFDQDPPVMARTVFLRNPAQPSPTFISSTPALAVTAPVAPPTGPKQLPSVGASDVSAVQRPLPAPPTQNAPPAQTPPLAALLHSASDQPVPMVPVLLAAALPPVELPHQTAALVSIVPVAPVFPGMAVYIAAANGLRTAMQAVMPLASPIQIAVKRIDPATDAVTTTLSSAELQALPVSGRRWEEFVADTALPAGASGSPRAESGNGGRQSPESTIDGVSTQLAFGDGSAASTGSRGQSSSADEMSEPQGMGQAEPGGDTSVSEAAVRSVHTFAGSASAHAGAGRMEVETQRGTDTLHGQASVFDRQNTWGARNPFTQWVQETTPATATTVPGFTAQSFTPSDHEMNFGIGAGSRIRRDKLFWFAALDGLARNDPAVSTVKHPYLCSNPPTCTVVTGFFAQPSNDQMQLLGAQLGTSTSAALAKYSQMLETLDGLLGPAARTAREWTGFARLDWHAAERHKFTLEATGTEWNSPGGGLTRTSEAYGNHSLGSSEASRGRLIARWEAYASPNLLAVAQVSLGRTIRSAHAASPSAFEKTLNQNIWGQLPQIVVDSRYGYTIGNPSRFGQGSYPDEHVYQAQESIDWVHGSLLVKAGIDLSHNADATSLVRNHTGTYYYANVENFATDALAFSTYGFTDALDKFHQHNCDQTGKAWRDASGQLRGLGYLPCYSHYTQMMGPTDWHLSTNDWAGFVSAQWQPNHLAVMSIGVRWQFQQLPPPIAALANPALPLTAKMPGPGFNWAPRVSFTVGQSETHWPVLRLGYGMYYGRTSNATLETVLTQTGSLKGDLNFFVRPTDNLSAGGAPPFPYVFAGEPATLVKPGAVEFAPNFRNPEIHQATATLDEMLPGRVQVSASALMSLGRRLPIAVDTNFDPAVNPGTITYAVVDATGKGPIKASQITVPFYALWPSSTSSTGTAGRLNPNYQQIAEIFSRANSTYEALLMQVSHEGRRGLSFHARYTYGHAMDWNPNESSSVAGNDVLDPLDFSREYGTGNLDQRHSAAITLVFAAPWKLHSVEGRVANGWKLSGVGQFHSGLPFTMRTSGSLPKEFDRFNGDVITGLGPGMNGSAGDNRIYGVGSDKVVYNIGRNTFRYPQTWKADVRMSREFNLGAQRQLQLLAESFNLFNHQNVTQLETTGYYVSPGTISGGLPTLNFLTGLKANSTAFGQPLNINATNYYRERQIQFGLRMTF